MKNSNCEEVFDQRQNKGVKTGQLKFVVEKKMYQTRKNLEKSKKAVYTTCFFVYTPSYYTVMKKDLYFCNSALSIVERSFRQQFTMLKLVASRRCSRPMISYQASSSKESFQNLIIVGADEVKVSMLFEAFYSERFMNYYQKILRHCNNIGFRQFRADAVTSRKICSNEL